MSVDPFPRDRVVVGSLCYLFSGSGADRAVLLLRRARPPQQGLWSAPGGKMHFGEAPDECVVREFLEETGLHLQQPQLRAIVTVVDTAWPIHWLLFIYRAEQHTGTLATTDEGELRWVPLDALADYPRPYADQQHWPHIQQEDPTVWRGKFVYDTPDRLTGEVRY